MSRSGPRPYGLHRPNVKDICRACRAQACGECVRYLWDGNGCDHDCDEVRQLGLFPIEEAD